MSVFLIVFISVIISIAIDLYLMRHLKRKETIANTVFGLQMSLMGMFVFYTVYNTTFYTPYGNVLPYFIATYFITTGFFISLMEYIKDSK